MVNIISGGRMGKLILLILAVFFSISAVSSTAFAVGSLSGNAPAATALFQYKKGLGAMHGKYYYTALQHFQKAIIINPHFARAWALMGVALHKLGFPSLAIVSMQKAIKYNPKLLWAKNDLKRYISSPRR